MIPQRPTPERSPASRRKPVIAAMAVLGALAISVAGWNFVAGGTGAQDTLSPTQAAERDRAFTGTVSLPLVASAERDEAIETMAIDPDARAALRADLDAGRARLAWLSLWDDQAEDGDRVRVAAGGFSLDLDLYRAPHRIGIPVTPGPLLITGLRDGGGGITLGIQEVGGVLHTPVIAPGQSLSMVLR